MSSFPFTLYTCDPNQSPTIMVELSSANFSDWNGIKNGYPGLKQQTVKYKGNCFMVDSFIGFGTTGTYTDVSKADFVIQNGGCSVCTPDKIITKKIYKLEPCQVGTAFTAFYTEDTVEDVNSNFGFVGFSDPHVYYRGECWKMTVDPTYTGSLVSWVIKPGANTTQNRIWIDGYQLKQTYGDWYNGCQTCIDANTQSSGGGGVTTYKFTPCGSGGSVFYTQGDVSALEESPGIYKIAKVLGFCYTIVEVTGNEPLSPKPIIQSSYLQSDGCAACVATFFEFRDCDSATIIYSKWSKDFQNILDGLGAGTVVKLQDQSNLCWELYPTVNTTATEVKKINGDSYVDCVACAATNLDMFKLVGCVSGTEYTQLALGNYIGKTIKKTVDDTCWEVESHSPVGGETVTAYSYTNFYTNGTLAASYLDCTECSANTTKFKLTDCNTGVSIYSKSVFELESSVGKIVKLQGMSGCFEVEKCAACSDTLLYQNVAFLSAFDLGSLGCTTCSTKTCFQLTNQENGQIKYSNDTTISSFIGQIVLLDDDSDGIFHDRYLVSKINTTSTDCDNAKAISFKNPAVYSETVHTLIDCQYSNMIQTTNISFDGLLVNDVVKVLDAVNNYLKFKVSLLDDKGDIYIDDVESPCFRYIGKTIINKSLQSVTKSGAVVTGNCTDCVIEIDGGDGVIKDSTIAGCVAAPNQGNCGEFEIDVPCIENSVNFDVTVTRKADSTKGSDLVINQDFWRVYNFAGHLNTPYAKILFIVSDQEDVSNNYAKLPFEKVKIEIPILASLVINYDINTAAYSFPETICRAINQRAFKTGIRAWFQMGYNETRQSSNNIANTLSAFNFSLIFYGTTEFGHSPINGWNINMIVSNVSNYATFSIFYQNVLDNYALSSPGIQSKSYYIELGGMVTNIGGSSPYNFKLTENGIYDVLVYNPLNNSTYKSLIYVDCFDVGKVYPNVFYGPGLTKIACDLFALGRADDDLDGDAFTVDIKSKTSDYSDLARIWAIDSLSLYFKAPEEGVYEVTVTRGRDARVLTYVIVSNCNIDNCTNEYFESIMCRDTLDYCLDCPDDNKWVSDLRAGVMNDKTKALQSAYGSSWSNTLNDAWKKIMGMFGKCIDCEDDNNSKPCKNC